MIRRLIVTFSAIAVAAFLTAAAVWFILRPPEPLQVPAPGAVLADVTVVNPMADRKPHQTLVVKGGAIVDIHDTVAGDSDAAFTKLSGSYVLPGLIDMHVHHPLARAALDVQLFHLLFLANGVTAVRDTGSPDGEIFEIRRRVESGSLPGPRIFACGPTFDGDPPFWPGNRSIRTAEAAAAVVDEVAAAGADCIKVYFTMAPDVLAAVREAARARQMPVIGHLPFAVSLEESRLDDVQHFTGITPLRPPSDSPIPTAETFDWITAWVAAFEALTPSRLDDIAKISRSQGIAHTPTLVFLDRLARLSDCERESADPAAHLLPRYYRELFWNPRFSPALGASNLDGLGRLSTQKAKDAIRQLHDGGVTIYAGTDTTQPFVSPGSSLHDELRLLVEAGFTVEEVLATATNGAGAALSRDGLGTVRVGAPADLLILRDDPTHDLDALDTIEAVVVEGRLYPKALLDNTIARYVAHADDGLYGWLTNLLASMMVTDRQRSGQ